MKKTPSQIENKTWMITVAAGVLVASMAISPSVKSSWAQDLPPQPMAITPATPEIAPATPEVPASAETTPVNPAEGAPSAAGAETQSSSGTYETLDPEAFNKLNEAMSSMAVMREKTTKPDEVGTLVFTLWQHSLLQDAKRLFTTRRPDPGEDPSSDAVPEERPRGVREISLSGILFKGKTDWVVWLNGQRLAPDALPKEVIDIKVNKDYIDLKWFDAYTNLIYPIRIRPHQRFNLDTRIFLPGITTDAAAQLQAASTGMP